MPEPNRGWWERNWKWFLPVGCLTVVLLAGAFVGLIVYGVFGMMKGSDAYTQALDRARASPSAIEALGAPIEDGWFVSGSWEESGAGGSAELSIPLSGPKDRGTLYVEAGKSLGAWTISALVLETQDGARIDLLTADAKTDIEQDHEPAPAPEDGGPIETEVEADIPAR